MSVAAPSHSDPAAPPRSDRTLFLLSLGLFFLWGLATVLIDILVPKLKGLFALGYAEVLLTQFAFFFGYFVFSLPAGMLVSRIGYMRGIVAGLLVMMLGCLLFAPAARAGLFQGFLLALFVMAAGITLLQVAANAVITLVGPASSAPSRLTLAQAFNSLGTAVGPLIGARLILADVPALPSDTSKLSALELGALRQAEGAAVQAPFLGIALLLLITMLVFIVKRDILPRAQRRARVGLGLSLLRRPRLALGVVAIFCYVGAEVAIGSLLANYLMEPRTLAVGLRRAGELVSLYWAGAMVGRFAGSYLLRLARPGMVLSSCAAGAMLLVAASALSSGWASAALILAVGLCNSIMFPTIFALSLEGCGEQAAQASGLLCMAIVGGAIIPPLTGLIADHSSLRAAFLLPIACYAWIVFFGRYSAARSAHASLPSTPALVDGPRDARAEA